MAIIRYTLGPMDNNTYLIVDEATQEAAIVDPSFDSDKLWPEIEAMGVQIRYILNTHAHFDHTIGNEFYVKQTNAPIALHPADLEVLNFQPTAAQMYGFEYIPSPEPTLWLEEGQTLMLGETPIRILFTPGHSPGSVTFLIGEDAIDGDVLFARAIGITNIPGGSHPTLIHSIRTQLLTLPDSTRVWPGHGKPTTIGTERATNPFLEE